MMLNILIGGKAGQGINKISEIVSETLVKHGYYTFLYRDYQSLIRGGHNFNILSISDKKIGSFESQLDGIVALDEKTLELHNNELKKEAFIITSEKYADLGINLNIALAGALIKTLGISKEIFLSIIKKEFEEDSVKIANQGYDEKQSLFNLARLNNKISLMSGNQGFALGALNSKLDLYFSYPITPATGIMNELSLKQAENNLLVFQLENEIAVANAALGASFTGAKVMIGTSGAGFDLMAESLSLQGQVEVPMVIYLASRPGPGTGVPTYTSQADLNIALMSGHGEFPRVVIAPGDPLEAVEKTNEAFFLSEKFKALIIIYSDKHLAESVFSIDKNPAPEIKIESRKDIPPKKIVKVSSYESDEEGNTTESISQIISNAKKRIEKTEQMKEEIKNFEMIKIHGKKDSKNLVIGWGSTKGVILDAIKGLDAKFLQVLYLEPFPEQIKEEILGAGKTILIEGNLTSQLGRLIREKTSLEIKEKILKYDTRPFTSDLLKQDIEKIIK